MYIATEIAICMERKMEIITSIGAGHAIPEEHAGFLTWAMT
jgi:hypothetical protein